MTIQKLVLCGMAISTVMAQPATQLRIIAIGAHPDDCDGKFAGRKIREGWRGGEILVCYQR
jgi:hypothetical protein